MSSPFWRYHLILFFISYFIDLSLFRHHPFPPCGLCPCRCEVPYFTAVFWLLSYASIALYRLFGKSTQSQFRAASGLGGLSIYISTLSSWLWFMASLTMFSSRALYDRSDTVACKMVESQLPAWTSPTTCLGDSPTRSRSSGMTLDQKLLAIT